MSTNFYCFDTEAPDDLDDGRIHIGKRSAAGSWCEFCDVSLCKDVSQLHVGNSEWHIVCPKCGRPIGDVGTTCSFIWAIDPLEFKAMANALDLLIVSDYDEGMSWNTFNNMLIGSCKYHIYDSIGVEFS